LFLLLLFRGIIVVVIVVVVVLTILRAKKLPRTKEFSVPMAAVR
jgi:hypothetical protein